MVRQVSSSRFSAASAASLGAPVRRGPRTRSAETVDRLLEAAHDEVRAVGHDDLTVRSVAARAGVSPATAYTYFSSKHHLIGELFARRLASVPAADADGEPVERLAAEIGELTDFLASEPELSAAVTAALLSPDQDVARVRLEIGTWFYRRFRDALGEDGDPVWLDLAELAFFGATVEAGMGLTTYEEVGERLQRLLRTLAEGMA